MNTSLVFAELIIIGLEGGIWLGLAFTAAFGTVHNGIMEPG